MNRTLTVVAVGLSTVAAAQQPTLTPHPLMVLTRDVTTAQVDTLQREYRRLLVAADVLLPTKSTLTTAVNELKRQDCASSDECLVRLAVLGNTMYALVLTAVREPDGTATLTGRVVRDDGKLMVGPLTKREARKASESVDATMMRAIGAWMADAKLGQLPAAKEVKPVAAVEVKPDAGVAVALAPVDAGVTVTPPPSPPLEPSGLSTAGTVTLVSGAGAATVGAALLLIGIGFGGGLQVRDGAVRADQAALAVQSNTFQGLGAALVGVGAAGVAAGAIMMAAGAPAVSVSPVAGGAMVTFGGTL